jgi:uncharacterized protein (TIGR03067 family)
MLRPIVIVILLTLAAAAPAASQGNDYTLPPGGYNGDALFEALGKLGYTPERSGPQLHYIKVTAAKMDVNVRVSVSHSLQYLWLRATLNYVDPAEVSEEAVRKLLAVNHEIGPAFYSYEPSTKKLYLSYRHYNGNFTQAKLKSAVQSFADILAKQEPNWRSENFVRLGTVPTDVSQPIFNQLQGEWNLVEYNDCGAVPTPEKLAALNARLRFEGDRMTLSINNASQTIVIDPRRAPTAIDFVGLNGRAICGLIRLEGNRLTIVQHISYGVRPKDFAPGSNVTLLVLERAS